MDKFDQAFIDKRHKNEIVTIIPIEISNNKIYFHWGSRNIYSLFISEVDYTERHWFFVWYTKYRITTYTFLHTSVQVQ